MLNKLRRSKGQGLVEYGLILVLVSVVVIVALAMIGPAIRDTLCNVVMAIDSGTDLEVCTAPRVTCIDHGSKTTGKVNVEALVSSPTGAGIVNVKFYVDGSLAQNEKHSRYCLGGGDSSCNKYKLDSGTSHTIRAVALDDEGRTGECSISVTAP